MPTAHPASRAAPTICANVQLKMDLILRGARQFNLLNYTVINVEQLTILSENCFIVKKYR